MKVWGGSPSTGGFAATRASKTQNRTSLGTVLEAQTAWPSGSSWRGSSAPEESGVTTSFVLSAFIGSEQVTTTLPDRSPALFNTSSKRRTGRAPHGLARPRWGTARSCAPTPSAEDRFLALTARSAGRSQRAAQGRGRSVAAQKVIVSDERRRHALGFKRCSLLPRHQAPTETQSFCAIPATHCAKVSQSGSLLEVNCRPPE